MARNRRGSGLGPPELRGTLGTLIRTAFQQAGGVREALEGVARTGRERFDEMREGRHRNDLLIELGEVVLDLVRRGEIDPAELPEARSLIRELDEFDDGDAADPAPRARPRGRFDDRGGPAPRRASPSGDDGTVASSARPSFASRGAAPGPARPAGPRVWRPPVDAVDDDPEPPRAAAGLAIPKAPPHPHKKGGISFDDDDDLADYMHPDDVPPKGTTDSGSDT